MSGAGCYNPSLASPGFFCNPGDNEACPDSQECQLTSGKYRCVNRNGRSTGTDGGIIIHSNDMAMMSGPVDMARSNPTFDFSMPQGGLTGCAGLITCVNACNPTDSTCPTTCESNATAQGNNLFMTLINCIVTDCPGDFPGDPCYDPNSTDCSSCFSNAQMFDCATDLSNCDNDLP
jgi:hypothetical protein